MDQNILIHSSECHHIEIRNRSLNFTHILQLTYPLQNRTKAPLDQVQRAWWNIWFEGIKPVVSNKSGKYQCQLPVDKKIPTSNLSAEASFNGLKCNHIRVHNTNLSLSFLIFCDWLNRCNYDTGCRHEVWPSVVFNTPWSWSKHHKNMSTVSLFSSFNIFWRHRACQESQISQTFLSRRGVSQLRVAKFLNLPADIKDVLR